MTDEEMKELEKSSEYEEVSGADLAQALVEVKRLRAENALLRAALTSPDKAVRGASLDALGLHDLARAE